ncbi:transaldolase family protein [Kitasatospora sp. NPDC051853]|uniref:transaldolase family protein n=1 Tax=Kitasatospora sp. NPDC051853 TaxID=3364058 RepID=UPI0037BBE567
MYSALRQLADEGVSLWLDGLCRDVLADGVLSRLVEEAGLGGATSNPRTLARSAALRERLTALAGRPGGSAAGAVRELTRQDARAACEVLLPLYGRSDGFRGLVSVDVDVDADTDADADRDAEAYADARPAARAREALVAAARELHRGVGLPNVLVKLPATGPGLGAVADCLAEGIGVHVTAVRSIPHYGLVVDAYFAGLERARAAGRELSGISSLAALPVGPLDRAVDRRLDRLGVPRSAGLHGAAGTAVARLAYHHYEQRLDGPRWCALVEAGARPQRLLWESGAPGPGRLEGLVAWGTVTSAPQEVLDTACRGFRPQGDTITGEHRSAAEVVDRLAGLGIHHVAELELLADRSLAELADSWAELRALAAGSPRASALPQAAPPRAAGASAVCGRRAAGAAS